MAEPAPTYPVALDRDIHRGSLVRARLDGLELVLWRANDDVIRVWEDRCPHRSIRLSAGRNLGEYVEGAYHGWRFGKDGAVIGVPAEGYEARPDIKVRTFATSIHAGFVWVSSGDKTQVPANYKPGKSDVLLRPMPFGAPTATVIEAIGRMEDMNLIVTPTSQASCFVFGHAVVKRSEAAIDSVRRGNDRLTILRRTLEARSAA